MIVDANDINVEILGKADVIEYDDDHLRSIIKDNPAGQTRELTPLILIREKEENIEDIQAPADIDDEYTTEVDENGQNDAVNIETITIAKEENYEAEETKEDIVENYEESEKK
ncbi:hypothetical protein D3C76_1519180 [compost metagenome]